MAGAGTSVLLLVTKVPTEFLPLNAFAAISLPPTRNSVSWDSQILLEQARKEGKSERMGFPDTPSSCPFSQQPSVPCQLLHFLPAVGNVWGPRGLCSCCRWGHGAGRKPCTLEFVVYFLSVKLFFFLTTLCVICGPFIHDGLFLLLQHRCLALPSLRF